MSGVLSLSRAEERIRGRMSAGKSPADIAAELSADERYGYTPEQVYAVISKILKSLDAYALDEQLKLSIHDLRSLAAEAKGNYSSTGRAEHLRGAVEALDKSMNHIEYLMDKSSDILETVDRKQAEMLVRIVERSFDRTLGALLARFPEVDKAEIESEFRGHLVAVARDTDEELSA